MFSGFLFGRQLQCNVGQIHIVLNLAHVFLIGFSVREGDKAWPFVAGCWLFRWNDQQLFLLSFVHVPED